MAFDAVLISDLDTAELQAMLKELETIDPEITRNFNDIKKATSFPDNEILEYLVLRSPVLFGKVYLGWDARDYQDDILEVGKDAKKLVLRLGRRLGKTECMCLLILWYGYVQPNKGPNDNQYNILIVTPFEEQVDLIFDRLHQLIDSSPILSKCISRDIHHRIEFTNGTIIKGLTAGSKNNTGAASTRGQRADLIILDEVDYMGSSEITNIINIRNEAPDRIRIIAASTPSGKREEYYQWCTGASLRLAPKQSDIDNFCFTGYEQTKTRGNGWIEIYAPSTVNKELLKINPDTEQTYLEDLKDELTEIRYAQEVMAEFGDEEFGVYQKKYIDWAVNEGLRTGHKYTTDMTAEELDIFLSQRRTGPRILGVDWDKRGASTNMVCIELDGKHTNENGIVTPTFKILFRVEIPRSEFTYTNAVNKIIELNDIYDFDWIAVDRGSGETQVELLHKYGMQHPLTGLHEKVVGVNFSEKIDVRDPYTLKKDKKKIKPFMVNNSVIVFERNAIMLNPYDKKLIKQFEDYRIKSIGVDGTPTFVETNEHIVDAVNLALFMFEQKYGDLLKRVTQNRCALLPRLDIKDEVKPRTEESKKNHNLITVLGTSYKNGYISDRMYNSARREVNRRMAMPIRRTF
jgi:replicative DNA helicase